MGITEPFARYANGDKEMKKALKDYEEAREKKKAPLTNSTKERLLEELNRLSKDRNEKIKIIEQSTDRNWNGFYELPIKEGVKPAAEEYKKAKEMIEKMKRGEKWQKEEAQD